MSGTGIDVVPYLPKCPVPALMSYRTYRSVGYRYRCRTELTEVSGTGNTGGIYRGYASVRTVLNTPFFACCSKGTLWIINWTKSEKYKRGRRFSLNLKEGKKKKKILGWFLCETDSELHILVRSQKQILQLVSANRNRLLVVQNRKRRRYSRNLFVCSCDSSAFYSGFRK